MSVIVEQAPLPLAAPSVSSPPMPIASASDTHSERRGRASNVKRITGYAGSDRSNASSTDRQQQRQRSGLSDKMLARYSSDSDSDTDESDIASFGSDSSGTTATITVQRRSPRDPVRRTVNVVQDLDTFAFDSDDEGEQTRNAHQEDDWLRSQGKNVRDVRMILDNSRKDGMIARQLLTEIGFDIHLRSAVGHSPRSQDDGDVAAPASPTGLRAVADNTCPPSSGESSPSRSQDSRSLSPQMKREPSPLHFARKPSLTSGSYATCTSRNGSTLPHHLPRPELAGFHRRSMTTEEWAPPGLSAYRMASHHTTTGHSERQQSSYGKSHRRTSSSRNGSTATIESLPWLRNLKGTLKHSTSSSTSAGGADDPSDPSYASLSPPEHITSAASSKKNRRLSGTLTSVCKAHATGVCERNTCDRHGSRAQILSLASGTLKQSLGSGRARSQSETHLAIEGIFGH